jgi:tetratricopeptide (TPR) repeat protein
MSDRPTVELPHPTADKLAELQVLYDTGRYLDAHHAARELAPLANWQTVEAQILAGRLAICLGDSQLGDRLHRAAYRQAPDDPDAACYYAYKISGRHGPLAALHFVRQHTARIPDVPATLGQAHLLAEHGRLLACYRDFTAADELTERAARAFPDDPWLHVERCGRLRDQDRLDEALAAAQQSTNRFAWYRPGIQVQIELLHALSRDTEALALMQEARRHLQSAAIVQTLILELEEQGRHAEILTALDEVLALSPLANRALLQWVAGRRCDALNRLGDLAAAQTAAETADNPYYKVVADRLAATAKTPGLRRVQVPLGFVRQHHMTCAPATLTALCNRWGGPPIDHVEVARAICYDGTPDHVERSWAETHGWIAREFRVTWESAIALLDRGCPFALVTVGVRNGHMQAVFGYDARLGTLIVRDPNVRFSTEWLAENALKSHAPHGPRGMVIVPKEHAELLTAVELPDAGLYDHYHRFRRALAGHFRDEARASLGELERAAPEHQLTLRARQELAFYDGNPGLALAPLRVLRGRHPEEVNAQLDELQLLERLGRAPERKALLEELCSRPGANPVFWRLQAEEITRDARRHPRTLQLLRRLLRRQAVDAYNLRALANLLWEQRNLPDATAAYRLAACLADKTEFHWESYFKASRHVGQTETCLALLRQRVAALGARSGNPARTLFDALDALDRTPEGFALLDEAVRLRPDDGDLLLHAAEARARYGDFSRAEQLMAEAKTRAAPAAWNRTAARLAGWRGDHTAALAHWRGLLALDPSDIGAQNAVVRLLAVCEGRDAALEHLRAASAAQPHQVDLRQRQVEWLRREPAELALVAADEMLRLDPAHSWALRERALILRRLNRLPAALEAAEAALRVAPLDSSSHSVRASVLLNLGRASEARDDLEAGIRLSVDADWMFDDLLAACTDFADKRRAIDFLQAELRRQPSFDSAPLAFRRVARLILSADELRAVLEELWRLRPTDWAVWVALSGHLLDEGKINEALEKASGAVEKFPLLPRLWVELAAVHARREDVPTEITALQRAMALNVAWTDPARRLSAAHEKLGQPQEAEKVLRRAIATEPDEGANHGWLAELLWKQDRREDAFAALEQALRLAPGYDWAWNRLAEWGQAAGKPNLAKQFAESQTHSRAGETASWLQLARLCLSEESPDASLAALARAEALAPREFEIYDMRAELLVRHQRYDEAARACRPAIFGDRPPRELSGRLAWIAHRRGNLLDAITQMKSVVTEHPDYLWGWSCLTEWQWENKQYERVIEAAGKWAWLSPAAAVPHGYIAGAHREMGRRPQAKEAYRRSLLAEPGYDYGAFELLAMLLADNATAEVEKVLGHIRTHFAPAGILRAELSVHRARLERGPAGAALQKLARSPGISEQTVQELTEPFFKNAWSREVEKAFAPLLAEEAASPAVGRLWVKACHQQNAWRVLWKVRRMGAVPPHRQQLEAGLLEMLGERNLVLTLRLRCWLKRAELRADDMLWGSVGYAFNTANRHRSTIRWMHDWRERSQLKPWMLTNYINACHTWGNLPEARAAIERAVAFPPALRQLNHLVWHACELAFEGRTDEAAVTLALVNEDGLDNYFKPLCRLARRLVEFQRLPPEQRRSTLREARADIRQLAIEYPHLLTSSALSRLHRRALNRLGQDGGSWWLRIRSRLPMLTVGASNQETQFHIPPWAFGVMAVMAFNLLRACTATGN